MRVHSSTKQYLKKRGWGLFLLLLPLHTGRFLFKVVPQRIGLWLWDGGG